MRRYVPLVLAAALAAAAACLPSELTTIRTSRLADGLTLVRGGGGNSLVLVRGERALVFDSKLWPYGDEVVRVLAQAGARTTLLVNSHLHGDHSGQNALHPGATLVASPQTIEYLAGNSARPSLTPFGDSAWIPVQKRTWVHLGGEPVQVGHLPAAHTDSDVFAWFPGEKTLATGDTFDHEFYPHVDPSHGGSYLGVIRALEELSEFDAQTVIPGHGSPATIAELRAYRDFMESLRDEVLSRRAKGESDDAIVAAMKEPRGEPYVAMGGFSSRERVVAGLVGETR